MLPWRSENKHNPAPFLKMRKIKGKTFVGMFSGLPHWSAALCTGPWLLSTTPCLSRQTKNLIMSVLSSQLQVTQTQVTATLQSSCFCLNCSGRWKTNTRVGNGQKEVHSSQQTLKIYLIVRGRGAEQRGGKSTKRSQRKKDVSTSCSLPLHTGNSGAASCSIMYWFS